MSNNFQTETMGFMDWRYNILITQYERKSHTEKEVVNLNVSVIICIRCCDILIIHKTEYHVLPSLNAFYTECCH